MKTKFEDVKELRIFRLFNAEMYKEVLLSIGAYEKKFPKGAYIALSEEKVGCVSVILSGTVHMESEDIWGNKTILVFMNRGDLFGETFACGSAQVSLVNFYAATPVTALYLPYGEIMRFSTTGSEAHRLLMQNIITLIADKNVRLIQKLEIVSKRTLRGKLLTYFSYMAKVRGAMEFDVPLGRVGLGEYLCADRSALTRELSRMREDGLIDFDRNHFKLLVDHED